MGGARNLFSLYPIRVQKSLVIRYKGKDEFHLDDVVQKLIKRYNLEGEIKRFVRTYAEMHMALHETKYIPNIDDLKLEDKKAILSDIYQMDLSEKDEHFVEIQFYKIMKREVRDIEKDIESIS